MRIASKLTCSVLSVMLLAILSIAFLLFKRTARAVLGLGESAPPDFVRQRTG